MLLTLILLLFAPLAARTQNSEGPGLPFPGEECQQTTTTRALTTTPQGSSDGVPQPARRRRQTDGVAGRAGLGEFCQNSQDCAAVEHAFCYTCNCTCRPGFLAFNSTTCSPANSTLTSVSATALTSSTVHVTWEGYAVIGYRLEWGVAGNDVRCYRNLPANQSSANITDLDPNTAYSVQLSAENRDSFNDSISSTLDTTVRTLMEATTTTMTSYPLDSSPPSSTPPSSSPLSSSPPSSSPPSSSPTSSSPTSSPPPLGAAAIVAGADLRDTRDPVTATWWVLLALVIALTFALILALACRRKKKKKKANSVADLPEAAEDGVPA